MADAAAVKRFWTEVAVTPDLGIMLDGRPVRTPGRAPLALPTPTLDQWAAAAKRVREDVIILCHGGPIANPEDAAYVLKHARECHGFYGASSMERLPTETAIRDQTRAFKALTF